MNRLRRASLGVMAVLVTAIHAFTKKEGVDARDEPAHDGVDRVRGWE
jgi:hypothetical protein